MLPSLLWLLRFEAEPVTAYVLAFFLQWHIAVLPTFFPKSSGVHNGQLTLSVAPRWKHVFHTQDPQQPLGAIVMVRHSW
jgi:hypothetical protein